MSLNYKVVGTVLCVLLSVASGCSQPTTTAKGIVQFEDGEKVQSGSIEFRSLGDGDRYASRIAKNGGYTLRNKHGDAELPAGDYEVVVVQIVLTEDLAAELHQHGRTVPRRYADYNTSRLRYTSDADRTEPIRIELKSDE